MTRWMKAHSMTRWIRAHSLTPSTDALVRATVFVTVLLVFLALGTLYVTSQGNDQAALARQSEKIRSCQSSFSAELVLGPTAASLKALAKYGADSAQFRAAVDTADPKRLIQLSKLSRTDPDRFLAICRRSDH